MWLKSLSVLINVTSFFVREKEHTVTRQCVSSLRNKVISHRYSHTAGLFSLCILTDVLYFRLYVLDNCPNDFTSHGSLLSA